MKIVNKLPPEAKDGQMVAMDIETFGQAQGRLHRPEGTFACISIKLDDGSKTVYQLYDSHDIVKVIDLLKRGTWAFHNSLYDLTQMRRFATIEPRFIWDTMLVERSMFGGLYERFSLRDAVRRNFGIYIDKEIRSEFETATEMTPDMKEYAARDAFLTMPLAIKQRDEFSESIYFNAYTQIDEPMIFPVLDMNPIKVDVAGWKAYVNELAIKAKEAEDKLGINSYSQNQVIAEAHKHHIHLENTQAATLAEFAESPFIQQVIEARRYRKAISTYGLGWLEKNVEEGDLVYPACHITGAETGRQSYSNPNMQNIPQRKMPHYRTLFISRNGRLRVSDITQQEPTILGFESKDPVLLAAIEAEEDLHQTVADSLPGLHKGVRDDGKTINLATSYGMTPQGLARKMDCSEDEAEHILKAYFQRFKGVFSWISVKRQEAYRTGFVTTAAHRRIYINPYSRQWENNAINGPIQGGAADYTKMWQRKIWEKCREQGIPYVFVFSVHDEVLQDPPPEIAKPIAAIEDEAFHETAATLYPGIKFRKESKTGKTWACKKLKEEIEDDEPGD